MTHLDNLAGRTLGQGPHPQLKSCPTEVDGKAPTDFNRGQIPPTATGPCLLFTVHFMFVTFVPCPNSCALTVLYFQIK